MKSFSEIETTSKRASRAAGFSWGVSEQIGKSGRLLEMFGLPGILNLKNYLEGISNHSVNVKLNYKLLNNVNVIYSSRYTDSKNIILFESGLKKSLEAHSISDILLSLKYRDVNMKFGVKNIFNYSDPSRNDSSSNEYLTSVDPGRRIYFNIGLNF